MARKIRMLNEGTERESTQDGGQSRKERQIEMQRETAQVSSKKGKVFYTAKKPQLGEFVSQHENKLARAYKVPFREYLAKKYSSPSASAGNNKLITGSTPNTPESVRTPEDLALEQYRKARAGDTIDLSAIKRAPGISSIYNPSIHTTGENEELKKPLSGDLTPSYMTQQGSAMTGYGAGGTFRNPFTGEESHMGSDSEIQALALEYDKNSRARTYDQYLLMTDVARGTSKAVYDQKVAQGRKLMESDIDVAKTAVNARKERMISNPSDATREGEEDLEAYKRGVMGENRFLQDALMTEDQKERYYYIAGQYGKEEAEKFRNTILAGDASRMGINQEIAEKAYQVGMKNTGGPAEFFLNSGFQVEAGIRQAGEELSYVPDWIRGEASIKPQSVNSYLSSMMIEDAKAAAENSTDPLEKKLNEAKAFSYELLQNTGHNAPSHALTMFLGPAAGRTMFSMQAGGGAYQKLISEGYDTGQAMAYGVMQAMDEDITNRLLGGIQSGGKGLLQKVAGDTMAAQILREEMMSFFGKTEQGRRIVAGVFGLNASGMGEFAQEFLQEFSEELEEYIATKEYDMTSEQGRKEFQDDLSLAWDHVKEKVRTGDPVHAGLLGYWNAVLMSGPSAVGSHIETAQTGRMSDLNTGYTDQKGKYHADIWYTDENGDHKTTISNLKNSIDMDAGNYADSDAYNASQQLWQLADALEREEAERGSISSFEIGVLQQALDDYQNEMIRSGGPVRDTRQLTDKQQAGTDAISRMERAQEWTREQQERAAGVVMDLQPGMEGVVLSDPEVSRVSWRNESGENTLERQEDGSFRFANEEQAVDLLVDEDQAMDMLPAGEVVVSRAAQGPDVYLDALRLAREQSGTWDGDRTAAVEQGGSPQTAQNMLSPAAAEAAERIAAEAAEQTRQSSYAGTVFSAPAEAVRDRALRQNEETWRSPEVDASGSNFEDYVNSLQEKLNDDGIRKISWTKNGTDYSLTRTGDGSFFYRGEETKTAKSGEEIQLAKKISAEEALYKMPDNQEFTIEREGSRLESPGEYYARQIAESRMEREKVEKQTSDRTLRQLSRAYDTAGAGAFIANYDGSTGLEGYLRAFSSVYNAARYNMKKAEASAFTALLSDEQVESIWKAGLEDGKKANEGIRGLQKYKVRQERGTGGVDAKASIPEINGKYRGLARTLDTLGKKTGIVFVITDTSRYENEMLGKEGAAGGYRNGVIVVDVNNSGNLLGTISHEMTHWLREYNTEGYLAFRDAAVRALQRNPDFDLEAALDKYRDAYPDLSREELMEEIVADSTGSFLNDEKFIEEVVMGNRTIGQRILTWLDAVYDAIRSLISNRGLNNAAYAMKKDLELYENARKLWAEAVEKAAETAETTEAGDGETRHSRFIKEGMTEAERYEILKDDIINITSYDEEALPKTGADLVALEKKSFTEAEKEAKRLAEKIGVIREGYKTPDLEIEFRYSSNNASESLSKQSQVPIPKRFLGYAKMLTCFDEILKNAQLIETHKDRYAGDKREDRDLKNFHILVSAFRDGDFIQPVKLGIKEFDTNRKDKKNGLYVAIAMPQIEEADALIDVARLTRKGSPAAQASASIIRLADLLGKIKENPKAESLGKYIPKQFAENGTDRVKKQLNMSGPVEQTKDLIALHNLNETKLNSLLEYEGIPMPSIAVTKADIGHENFGGISFVFRKDTIDPKNKKNKVYSADAWTPTFPRIEYQANEKAETRIREKFYSLQEKYGRDVADPLYSYGNVLEDSMNRYNGAAGILEKENENPRMVKAYLYDIGRGEEIPGVETVEKETRTPMSEKSIELGNFIIDSIGRDAFENKNVKMRDIREAYRQRLIQVDGMSEERANEEVKKRSPLFYDKIVKVVKSVLKGETENVTKTTVRDSKNQDAFLKAEMQKEGYKKWLRDLFNGVEKGRGIYNGKDFYTSSGSRRSFKATHYDVTAANIVKAMLAQNEGKSQNAGGFIAGVKSLRSSAAERFRSINDIKKASAVLKDTDSATYQNLLEGLSTRLYDSISEVKKDKGDFFETDNIGNTLIEAIETHKTSVEQLKTIFEKYGYDLSDDQAQAFSDLIEDIRNMPVNMFEAKPERVVGWDEVAAAVLPDTTSSETLSALRAHGVNNIYLYEEGNETERKKIISGMDNVRFQKKVDEEASTTRRIFIDTHPDLQKAFRELNGVLTAYRELAPTQDEIRRNTRAIAKKFGSDINVNRVSGQIESLYKYLAEGNKPDGQQVTEVAMEIANDILDEATHSDPEVEKRWQTFKKEMRKRRIYIPKDRVNDLNPDGLKALRRQWHGKMLFTTDEKYRERYGQIQYQELQQLFPDYFTAPAEEFANDVDAIQEIMAAFDAQAPIYEKVYKGATREEAALELSYDIMQGYFSNDKGQERFKRIYRDYVKPIKEQAIMEYQDRLRSIQIQDAATLEQRNVFQRIRGLGKTYIVSESALKDAHLQERRAMVERYKEKAEQEKRHYQEKLEKQRAGYIDRQDKERLMRLAKQLEKMKGGPEFEQRKRELIGDLDLVAKGLSTGLEIRLEDQRREYERLQETDPTFEPDRATLKVFERLDKRQINSLKSHEIRELIQAIIKCREDQWNHNRLIREQDSVLVSDMGKKWIKETRSLKGTRIGTFLDKVDSYSLAHLNAKRAFRKMSGYREDAAMMELFHELNEGQHKQMDFQRRAQSPFDEFMKSEENREFITGMFRPTVEITSSKVELKGDDGKVRETFEPETVLITPAMKVSIYLHSLNQDNREHALYGGFRIPNMAIYEKGRYAESYGQGSKILRFNREDLKKIADSLTEPEQRFADLAWKYFNEVSKEAINSTSMLMDGYEKAVVDDYMPIKTDRNFTKKDMSGLIQDGTIWGQGFLKERNFYAKNPILLEDITQVLERSIRNTGLYYGLAVPVRNFEKVYNFQKSGYADSVKESIQQTFGMKGNQYIEKVIRDLQGGSNVTKDAGGEAADRFTSALRGNYAGAVLALNPSVAIKQAASYPTAAAKLGWGPLTKALAKLPTKTSTDMETINKYTPLLWYRTQGQSSDALAEVAKRKNAWQYNGAVERTRQWFNWIQNIDVKTVKTLWYASEYFVQDNYVGLEQGSDDYYKKVAEVFNEVVEDTQPNYTTLQRASISRADNELLKTVFMFKTQPLQNLGILYDSFRDYQAKREDLKAAQRSGDDSLLAQRTKELAVARRNWAHSVSAITVSTAVFSAMTQLAAMLLRRMDPFRDPETGELTGESMGKKFLQNSAESLSGMMLGAGELYSLIMAAATGSQMDDISVSGIDSLNQTVSKMLNLYKVAGDALQDENKTPGQKALTIGKASKNLALQISEITGIPLKNANKIAEAIMNGYADISSQGFRKGVGAFEAGANIKDKQYAERVFRAAYERGDAEGFRSAYLQEVSRLRASGKDDPEKELKKKLKAKLKETDEMQEALEANLKGDNDTYEKKIRELTGKGFGQSMVMDTFNAMKENRVKKASGGSGENPEAGEEPEEPDFDGPVRMYSNMDIADAYMARDRKTGDRMVEDAISYYTTQGKTVDEFRSDLKRSITSKWKPEYIAADTKRKNEIRTKLYGVGVRGRQLYKAEDFEKWTKDAKKKEQEDKKKKQEVEKERKRQAARKK